MLPYSIMCATNLILIFPAEDADLSKVEEDALIEELMSQLAEPQADEDDENDEDDSKEGDDGDDDNEISGILLQRYLNHLATFQEFEKAKAQGWFRRAIRKVGRFVKKGYDFYKKHKKPIHCAAGLLGKKNK